jgi:hypothetical protein
MAAPFQRSAALERIYLGAASGPQATAKREFQRSKLHFLCHVLMFVTLSSLKNSPSSTTSVLKRCNSSVKLKPLENL